MEFRTRYSACNDNYNGYCYVNTMNREAIDKYLESTHENTGSTAETSWAQKSRGFLRTSPTAEVFSPASRKER